MHTDQSRWLQGQARGQQGGCGVRPGARGVGGEARGGWTPIVGPRAPGPAAPGLASSAPCPWPGPAATLLPPGLALQPPGLVCMHFGSKVWIN